MAPDLLTLFVEPSVALLYFMSLIVVSCAALFMAFGQRSRGAAEYAARRYALASLGITLAWLALMIGAVVALLTNTAPGAIIPPLDRAIGAAVVVLTGWAFLVPERDKGQEFAALAGIQSIERPSDRRSDKFTAFLAVYSLILIAVAYLVTAADWSRNFTDKAEFNRSMAAQLWTLGTLALSVIMIALLLVRFRSIVDVPLKFLFFALVLVGCGITAISIQNGVLSGNDSGAMRLAFLASMPLLPVVIYRLVVDRLASSAQERATQATVSTLTNISQNLLDTTAERESVTLLKALGAMLEREKPEDLPRQIAVSAANLLKADVTALVVIDDAEYADVIAAYDNIQQRFIASMAIKLDEQPTVQEALSSRIQRSLSTDINLNELVDLFTRLDIQKIGPVYIQPLLREGELIGVLLVCFPYTQRDLRESEKRLLESISPIASRLLAVSRAATRAVLNAQARSMQAIVEGQPQTDEVPISTARAEMQASLELARQQINELSGMVRDLQIELDFERSRIAELASSDPEGLSVTQRIEKMKTERVQLESERERLVQALQEAQAQLISASGTDDEAYEAAIQILQKERDELQSQKEALETQLSELRGRGESQAPSIVRTLLTQLSQEKSRFAAERDQLKSQLDTVNTQLAALGIEGGSSSLVSTVVQLTDERTRYRTLAERALKERNLLLAEIQKFKDKVLREQERDKRIQTLENELKRLAQDREALTTQRDSLRQEREHQFSDRSLSEQARADLQDRMASLQKDLERIELERNKAIAERNKLAEERATLLTERDRLIAGRTTLQTERDQLLARIEGNREILQQLGADGVDTLKNMIDDLTEERSDLEHRLVQSRKQNQALRDKLDSLERSLKDMRKSRVAALDEETTAVMLSVAQELRTPLNAIGAYTDLLLGESVGVLADLQQQFLQRVKANSDRLATLVEDFIRVVAIDTGTLRLKAASIDFVEIVDDSITATRTQFREKGITLKLDVQDDLPPLEGDRGALQQVMVELLSNAYRASPTDGEVAISAKLIRNYRFDGRDNNRGVKDGAPLDVIYASVTDRGGGVPVEEQARVFNRFYHADHPLVQGIGDTGVGLSIARSLAEMHNGRLWLESAPGESSTFILVLPLQGLDQAQQTEGQKAGSVENVEHVAS